MTTSELKEIKIKLDEFADELDPERTFKNTVANKLDLVVRTLTDVIFRLEQDAVKCPSQKQ